MSAPSVEAIKAARAMFEDQHYTKQIECPIHPAHEARDHHDPDDLHQATLYVQGHRYAGIWECPITGESDSHEHDPEHFEIDTEEHLSPNPDSSYYWTSSFYVCGGPEGCGVAIDLDVANPAEDAADAEADNWRDE